MGLFFPILLGTFALAIIVIGLFAAVTTLVGFLTGGIAYAAQKEKKIETFARVWLSVTGVLIFLGLIFFILWL
jgi:hypothetical protein